MRVGETHRLRFMSIPANGEYVVRLTRDGQTLLNWRQIARDGADLPPQQITEGPATSRVDVGIIKDFEFSPIESGALVLVVDLRLPGSPTRLPIRVLPRE